MFEICIITIYSRDYGIQYRSKISIPISMANTSCYPLREFWITRAWEETTIITICICVSIGIGIGVVQVAISLIGVLVLTVALLLLSNVNKYQESSSKSHDEKTLQHPLIDIKLKIIVVTVIMLSIQAL